MYSHTLILTQWAISTVAMSNMFIEGVLLGAAAIEALLRRSGNLQANNGAAALAAPAADGVASGALPSPVLELSCAGQKLLSVRVQLRTGRLLLRAGDNGVAANSGNLGQELSPLLRQVLIFSPDCALSESSCDHPYISGAPSHHPSSLGIANPSTEGCHRCY